MNEILKDSLQVLLNHPTLMAAVKRGFADAVEDKVPRSENGDNNLILGEKFRAYESAKLIIAQAFNDMERYRKAEKDGKEDTMHI